MARTYYQQIDGGHCFICHENWVGDIHNCPLDKNFITQGLGVRITKCSPSTCPSIAIKNNPLNNGN